MTKCIKTINKLTFIYVYDNIKEKKWESEKMFCPECGKPIEDNLKICSECGKEIPATPSLDSAKRPTTTNMKRKKKVKKPSKFSQEMKKLKTKKAFWIFIIAIAIVLTTLIVAMIIKGPHPITTAEKLSEKLGKQIVELEKNAGIHVSATSESEAINSEMQFDYIYESEKIIKVDGVKVPEWIILFHANDNKIDRIIYRDFSNQKKNYKGEKLKEQIDFEELEECTKLKEVEELLKLEPTSISYSEEGFKTYGYRYYYIDENKDEACESYIITVDEDNKVTSVNDIEENKLLNSIK